MVKFYKNIKDYAEQNWMCRQTASKKLKNWELDLMEVPKGAKWIDWRDIFMYGRSKFFWIGIWDYAEYNSWLNNPRTDENMFTEEEILNWFQQAHLDTRHLMPKDWICSTGKD